MIFSPNFFSLGKKEKKGKKLTGRTIFVASDDGGVRRRRGGASARSSVLVDCV